MKYVRIEVCDTYGISRGVLTTKQFCEKHLEKGLSMVTAGTLALTPASDIVDGSGVQSSVGYCDSYFYPDISTLMMLPWLPNTASILGDMRMAANDKNSQPAFACSRGILKDALKKLNDLGLSIYGAYEYEFYLSDLSTGNVASKLPEFMIMSRQADYHVLATDIMDNLEKCGIVPETFHIELGVGQMEITTAPVYGIEVADNAFRYKQIVKEVCKKYNFNASFMSKPYSAQDGSSAHLNHSLWNQNGENVFYDSNDKNHLSQVAKHWLAGIQYHSKALTCLIASTPNCFERFSGDLVPSTNVWGFDNRSVCYRVKNIDQSRTYIENRLPGAATNQHLVLAAMIYAGIDGIQRKLELKQKPFKGDASVIKHDSCPEGVEFLPSSLTQALECLNKNEMFTDALGDEFLKCFNVLRRFEISKYEEAKQNGTQWEWHEKQYSKFM